MSQQQHHHRVDPNIWQKFAGDSFTVPKLHSKVYYFPQGHLENVLSNIPITQTLNRCRILCTVSAIDLLADPQTDQVYAKLLLTPVMDGSVVPLEASNEEDSYQIVSYAKTVTKTDVRSGGVLYIPKACADAIFPALPPLDSRNQSRFQDLNLTDVCGDVWNIRHFHRLHPFQHQFTVGWCRFVSQKKLVGGDTVVFVKNSAGNISVGIRRNAKLATAVKMTEKEVKMALELAERNAAFEVVYYPTVGGFDFVVGAKTVEDAKKVDWCCGMRVTHMVKNDDTAKGCSIFNGTISVISHPSTRPWRMLQVKWDDPQVPENLKQLSPWQVELINSHTPIQDIQFPLTKKLRGVQGSVLSSNMHGSMHNRVSPPTSYNFLKNDFHKNSSMEGLCSSAIDLNISNPNTKKTSHGSIMLFGQRIQPIERDLYDFNIIGDHGRKRNKEVEDIDKTCSKIK